MFCCSYVPHGCKCGYHGDRKRECRCSDKEIQNYRGKISGPLLDRIDIHVEVPAVEYRELASLEKGEGSKSVRERVVECRKIQRIRFKSRRSVHSNAGMTTKDLQVYCHLNDAARDMVKMAMSDLHFSARAYNRILKVARTIADLDGSVDIQPQNVGEAIQYRTLDRQLWV